MTKHVIPQQVAGDGPEIYTKANGRTGVRTVNETESATVQSDRHEAQMKFLLQRYEGTGLLPAQLGAADLAYRDVTSFDDYADAMRHAEGVKAEFMQLDPRIRRVFDNDHLEWLDAAKDGLSAGQERALERLGVLKVAPPPAQPPASSTQPTAAPVPPASD